MSSYASLSSNQPLQQWLSRHDEIPSVPHQGEIVSAAVWKVYDGDTISVIILHGGVVPMKLSVRVTGVDTPEIKSNSSAEKLAAQLVRDDVSEKLLNQIVKCRIDSWDKYGGRVVGEIFFRQLVSSKNNSYLETALSEYLLASKLARPYGGDTKKNGYSEETDENKSFLNGIYLFYGVSPPPAAAASLEKS